jgi:hypothetical protein
MRKPKKNREDPRTALGGCFFSARKNPRYLLMWADTLSAPSW